jgi:predicted aldo/keto reductase-like oxidoreductase
MSQRKSREFDRRKFIGTVSSGAVGAGLGLSLLRKGQTAEEPNLERRNEQPGMVYARFGKTNLNVSRLSFGCIQLQDDRLPVLEMAVERGVNVVHISEGYNRGRSIASLGKFLKVPGNRDKVFVMLKGVHGRGIEADIDAQLKQLNTDHVDVICAPIFEPDAIRGSEEQRETYEALKKKGKVRFLNLTTHKSLEEGMRAGISVPWYSSILSVIDLSNVDQFKPAIQLANEANVGIMAMKTVRYAATDTPAKIAPAMFGAGVTTILRSINTREYLDEWMDAVPQAAKQAAAISSESRQVAEGFCTLCGVCEDCPNGVAIQDVVRDYTYYYENQRVPELARERYAEIPAQHRADACQDCGRCEEICPYNVPVRRILAAARMRLGTTA